jgi:uncharacterized membrane protein
MIAIVLPRFATLELENVGHAWLWLLAIAAGLALLAATYRAVFARGERRLVWALMLLRAAGLAALVVALARPVWTRVTEIVDPGRVAIVLDDSLSMSLADAGGQSRYSRAKTAAERWRKAIAADDGQAAMAADWFDIGGQPLARGLPDEPRAPRTDLVGAVRQAVRQLRSQPLTGVILVSDGMDNTGVDRAHELADLPLPVYTVGFPRDDSSGGLDLSLTSVQAPDRVIVHNDIKVDVRVAKQSGPALEAAVVIKRGEHELARQSVSLAAGDATELVSVPLRPAEPGTFVYTAAITAEAGERQMANNSRHFPLVVDADAIKVFYVEGFLRFEYKFLKNRLEDDPDVSLASVVRRANPRQTGAASHGELLTPERLKEVEVVILGDLEGGDLTSAEYQALIEWIEVGHALLVLGGYHSFGERGFRTTPLAEALPVVFAQGAPGESAGQSEDPFTLQLTERGRQHPIFQVSGDRVKDAALWNSLPQLSGTCLVERAKAGADVLAVDPSFVSDSGPAVVIAAQRYGAGHTMVVAADTTWRWSRLARIAGQPDTLYARFWSQTVRWLAGRELKDARPPLIVSTNRPDYDVGKPVEVRVSVAPTLPDEAHEAGGSGVPPVGGGARQPVAQGDHESPPRSVGATLGGATSAEPRVTIVDEAGKSVALPVRANSAQPDMFTGVWHAPAGGRYRVEAALAAEGVTAANQSAEFLVNGPSLELADIGTDADRLRGIAKLTGGLYFDISEADDVTDKIKRRQRRLTKTERSELWSSGKARSLLFVFFLVAVTAEWLLRRRNHLV